MYQKKQFADSKENKNIHISLINWSWNKLFINRLKNLKDNKNKHSKKTDKIGTIIFKFSVNKKGRDIKNNHNGWKPVEGYMPFHENKFPFANSLA